MPVIRPPTTRDTVAELSNRLRLWRVDKGLSLEEVSDLVGLSPAMLSRVERGERRLAPLTRVHVARRLGARVADLFDVEPLDEEPDSAAV